MFLCFITHLGYLRTCLFLRYSEAVLAEMGVALKDDSSLVGVFSPKKVSI